MKLSVLLLVLLGVAIAFAAPAVNLRPIIGILTEPDDDYKPTQASFSASYVKWLESGGSRVAVVPYNAPQSQLDAIFGSINGLLFTGGGLSLAANTTYFQTAQYLFNKALAANQAGDYFPVWGTCMGFQMLCILVSQNHTILSEAAFDSENLGLALNFTAMAAKSRLFADDIDGSIYKILGTQPVTINLHHDGVRPSSFHHSDELMAFYDVISTNRDRFEREFVSMMEAKNFPIYGAQWHAERNQFEWDFVETGLDKSFDAIRAVQFVSRFFVNEARKSQHTPAPGFEDRALIYNYVPVYTGNDPSQHYPDEQTYVFSL